MLSLNVVSLVSLFPAFTGLIPALVGCAQVLLSASSSPSRATGTLLPTLTTLDQEKAKSSTLGALILGSILVAIISASVTCSRTRTTPRQCRVSDPDPSNPHNSGPEDDEHPVADEHERDPDSEGDDDPEQDGGTGVYNGNNSGGLWTASAPNPEDPTPPSGEVEEDGEGERVSGDRWLGWLMLLFFLWQLRNRNGKINHTEDELEVVKTRNVWPARRTRGWGKTIRFLAIIPGLVFVAVIAWLVWTTSTSTTEQHQHPQPPPAPPLPPPPPPVDPAHLLLVARLKRTIQLRAARKRAVARRARFFKALFFLVAGPALVFFLTVLGVLWGLLWAGSSSEADAEDAEDIIAAQDADAAHVADVDQDPDVALVADAALVAGAAQVADAARVADAAQVADTAKVSDVSEDPERVADDLEHVDPPPPPAPPPPPLRDDSAHEKLVARLRYNLEVRAAKLLAPPPAPPPPPSPPPPTASPHNPALGEDEDEAEAENAHLLPQQSQTHPKLVLEISAREAPPPSTIPPHNPALAEDEDEAEDEDIHLPPQQSQTHPKPMLEISARERTRQDELDQRGDEVNRRACKMVEESRRALQREIERLLGREHE